MDLIEGLTHRRSIRGFRPDPIKRAVIEDILTVAARSPSYTNTQPWEVAVVTGQKRDALSHMLYDLAAAGTPSNADVPAPKTWPEAAGERSKIHNINRFKALGIGRDDAARRDEMRLQNFKFFGAPCVFFIFMDEGCGPWSTMDMGGFTHAITLAAQAHGLGTCLQASLTHYPDVVRSFLDIPATKQLLVGMSIGVPDLNAPLNAYHSARMAVTDFVQWYD
jgi:nitroreductase